MVQFDDYQATIEANNVIAVLQDFMDDVQACWCNTCLSTLYEIWAIAACAITSGLQQSADHMWRSLKLRICAQWSTQGRFEEARKLFFHEISCPDIDPIRPSHNSVPEWFVQRLVKEFPDVGHNCINFASNDFFYQTAWQSVPKNLVQKMEGAGQSNKSNIWAKCKRILVKTLKTFTNAEHDVRCKIFTRYFALQREYKHKGVVRSNSLIDEAYCVTMMQSGDFMHRVLRSVEIMEAAVLKVDHKPVATSGVEVRVHAPQVGPDERYTIRTHTHGTVNIRMIDAKTIVDAACRGDDEEIRTIAAFAAEAMEKDPARAQQAFELAKAMTETTEGIKYMQTIAQGIVGRGSCLTDKAIETLMDMVTVPTGALEGSSTEVAACKKRRARAQRKRDRQRAEIEAWTRNLVVGVVESVPELAVQQREAQQAALEARLCVVWFSVGGLCFLCESMPELAVQQREAQQAALEARLCVACFSLRTCK